MLLVEGIDENADKTKVSNTAPQVGMRFRGSGRSVDIRLLHISGFIHPLSKTPRYQSKITRPLGRFSEPISPTNKRCTRNENGGLWNIFRNIFGKIFWKICGKIFWRSLERSFEDLSALERAIEDVWRDLWKDLWKYLSRDLWKDQISGFIYPTQKRLITT